MLIYHCIIIRSCIIIIAISYLSQFRDTIETARQTFVIINDTVIDLYENRCRENSRTKTTFCKKLTLY